MSNNFPPRNTAVLNSVLNAPLIVTAILGNTLVLAAILRTPSLRSPSIMLLCSLAVSDLLVGLVVQPVYFAYLQTEKDFLYQPLTVMAFSACCVPLYTITAVSVDRFLALNYYMRYPTLMTTHRAMKTSAILWLVCFLLSLFSLWNKSFYFTSVAVNIVICILISTVCYIRIFRIVRQHQFQIYSQKKAVESLNTENTRNMLRKKLYVINTFIYYIVMMMCYVPAFIGISIFVISPNSWTWSWMIAETVAFMNSSINPILYCWRHRELRAAVVKTARQMLRKKNYGKVIKIWFTRSFSF